MRKTHILLIAILAFGLTYCSDDDTNPTDAPVTESSENAILPLEVGNYWVFETVTMEQDSTTTQMDTMKVVNVSLIGGDPWYRVEDFGTLRNFGKSTAIYAKNTESIIFPYTAAVGDTMNPMTESGILEGEVLSTELAVSVPAGDYFCYVYKFIEHTGAEYTFYLSHRIGFIRMEYRHEFTSPQFPNGYSIIRTSNLVEYHLER